MRVTGGTQDAVAASGGMAAAGDTILHLFLGGLFLIPTAFLIWIIAKSEALYTAYSRFLFGLSLSAPICMSVLLFGEKYVALSLSSVCSESWSQAASYNSARDRERIMAHPVATFSKDGPTDSVSHNEDDHRYRFS